MIRNRIYTWLMTVWILCGICHTASAAPYDRSAQSASWGYQPASTATVPSSARVMDEYECPAFNFQSTSPYSAPVGSASSGIITQSAPRRSTGFSWDDPEDNPVGVLPNPAPVGEPLVLLVLALLYIVLRKKPTPDPSLKGREI